MSRPTAPRPGAGSGLLVTAATALLGLAAAAGLALAGPGASRAPLRGSDPAYPPPPVAPSPTPSPDAAGFLPLPPGLPHQRVSPALAPAADLVLYLDQALARGDAAALAALAASPRRPLLLFPWGPPAAEGVDALAYPARLVDGLAPLLSDPDARPRLQGLFHLPSPADSGACALLLLHGFPPSAPWPAPSPPAPLADPAPPVPAALGADAAAWRFCRAPADLSWTWEQWQTGPYHALLARLGDLHPEQVYWWLRP